MSIRLGNTLLAGTPDISGKANTSLNNLDATGQAVINGKVSKTGDTMTGVLKIGTSTNEKLQLFDTEHEKGTNPESSIYTSLEFNDKNNLPSEDYTNTRVAVVEASVATSGNVTLTMAAYKNEVGSSTNARINVVQESGGTAYATAPTPSATSDNSTKIATTAWFNNKIKVVSSLPASPDSNVYYFVTG